MLRFSFLLLVVLCYTVGLRAQVGVSAHYLSSDGQGSALTTPSDAPQTGWQVGVDYWFRLKQARIEFLPTLAYSSQRADAVAAADDITGATTQGYHFFFTTHIYPFDLKGDCDCPTFSKEGPTLQKGFFLQLAPGISYLDVSRQTSTATYGATDTALSLGAAVGFDIGFSDLFTLTPMAGLRYYPSATQLIPSDTNQLPVEYVAQQSEWLQYTVGVRLGWRW